MARPVYDLVKEGNRWVLKSQGTALNHFPTKRQARVLAAALGGTIRKKP